jgi:hypothetical protein
MIKVLTAEEGTRHLESWLGADPQTDEGLFDLLRAEVHGRGVALRATTLQRVQSLLGPQALVAGARIDEACSQLEREGDLQVARGGWLAATPARAVAPARGGVRLFSSLPTRDLAAGLRGEVVKAGVVRTIAAYDELSSDIAALKGVAITAEDWAGLNNSPVADNAFLQVFDTRLEWEAREPGTFDRAFELDWRGREVGPGRTGWYRNAAGAQLWKASGPMRRQFWAWTNGDGSPGDVGSVELSTDEANRAVLALHRRAGTSPAVVARQVDDAALLDIPLWLPRAEYRWLSLQAEPAGIVNGVGRWRVAVAAADNVLALLTTRVGLPASWMEP